VASTYESAVPQPKTTTLTLKITAFWDIVPYSLVEVDQHLGAHTASIIRVMMETS